MQNPKKTDLVDDFARGLSRLHSRRSNRAVLRRFFLDKEVTPEIVTEITPSNIVDFLQVARGTSKLSTVEQYLRYLRRFFKWLATQGLIPSHHDPTRSNAVENWLRKERKEATS